MTAAHKKLVDQRAASATQLAIRRVNLDRSADACRLIHDVDDVRLWLEEMQVWSEHLDQVVDGADLYRATQERDRYKNSLPLLAEKKATLQHTATTICDIEPELEQCMQSSLAAMRSLWTSALAAMKIKDARLVEVASKADFLQNLEGCIQWCDATELVLSSTDEGRDVSTSQALYDRFASLHGEVDARQTTFEKLRQIVAAFTTAQHFDAVTMTEQFSAVSARNEAIQSAVKAKVSRLAQAVEYFQFCRDASDIHVLVAEKQEMAAETIFGTDVRSAQALRSLHDMVEKESLACRTQLQQLYTTATALGWARVVVRMGVGTSKIGLRHVGVFCSVL